MPWQHPRASAFVVTVRSVPKATFPARRAVTSSATRFTVADAPAAAFLLLPYLLLWQLLQKRSALMVRSLPVSTPAPCSISAFALLDTLKGYGYCRIHGSVLIAVFLTVLCKYKVFCKCSVVFCQCKGNFVVSV